MHALELLRAKTPSPIPPLVVLVGEERFLKLQALDRLQGIVLADDPEHLGLTRFSGETADLKTVCDELLTVSMWGTRRLVVIEEADRFISDNRAGLEKYAKKPAKKSVLVLDVKSWSKSTRLAKLVTEVGLQIDCTPLSRGELVRWTSELARTAHAKTLGRDAAALLIELAGDNLGLLEQEVAKLAAYVGTRSTIESDDVRTLVGGWRAETTWAITGAIRRGRTGEAIDLLDKLLDAGESPYKILGGVTFVFRRLAQAVELVRQGDSLEGALRAAGVFPGEQAESSAYLRRLGRNEARLINARLLQADMNLKGAVVSSPRQALETLIVTLGGTSGLLRPK
jgi:DNA polymerase III subunit delta